MQPYYEDASVTLYHGDCREILPQLEMVEHVITDPPYGEHTHGNAKSNRGNGSGHGVIDFASISFDELAATLRALGSVTARWLIATMEWRHIARLERETPDPWEFVRFGVWVKTNPMPQISADRPANGWEGISYLHKRDLKKRWNGGGEHGNWIGPVVTNGLHPTAKPEAFIEKLIAQFTDLDDLILDPFAGSGTTAVVAKRMERRCIAIERDEKYCEVAARRLSIRFETLEGGLFAEHRA